MRAFLLATALLGSVVPAQSLLLRPDADATTDQNRPTVNFGTDVELGFGKNFSSTPNFTVWFMRGHLHFDLAPVIGVARWPVRASLHWYQHRASAAGCLDVSVHRVLAAWSESTITWQNKPAHDPLVIGSVCVGDGSGTGWKEIEMTALVQDWLTGQVPNFGIVIRDPSESNAGAARPGFAHSRENGNPSFAPYLEVEFAERFGVGCSMRTLIPISDVTAGRTKLGGTFTLGTHQLTPGSAVGMLFGTSNTVWSAGPLPWSLAPLGFPSCRLNVSPDIAVTFPSIASNGWNLVIPLPSDPLLNGAALFMQTVALSPTTPPTLEMANGVGVVLRQ